MSTSGDIGRQLRQQRTVRRVLAPAPGPIPELDRTRRVTPWRLFGLLVAGALLVGVLAVLPARADGPTLAKPAPPPVGGALGEAAGITPGLPPIEVLERLVTTPTTTTVPAEMPARPVEMQASAPEPSATVANATPMDGLVAGGHLPDWAWDAPGDLSITGMAAVMMAVGCPSSVAPIMAAIGEAESRGRTSAVGDVHLQGNGWGPSVSFMQVRTRVEQRHTGQSRDAEQIHDMWWHARAAFEISEQCTNAFPWSTWRFGQALEHLPAAIGATLWLRGAS